MQGSIVFKIRSLGRDQVSISVQLPEFIDITQTTAENDLALTLNPVLRDAIMDLAHSGCSAWESSFLINLIERRDGYRLSPKQVMTLKRIQHNQSTTHDKTRRRRTA